MHDQSLEQNLRAALQAEGDGLAFTITAAELERRLVLRRRGRPGPMASLGLAAAVGVGLLGLAGLAGGWFEQRTAVVPPSPSPVPSVLPSSEPSASPSGQVAVVLPTLEQMVEASNPTLIVRVQAVGPATGPATDDPPTAVVSRGAGFAAVSTSGTYLFRSACLGDDRLEVVVLHAGSIGAEPGIPTACDGEVTVRTVDLQAGDSVTLRSASAISWRVVLESPAREALHAESVADIAVPDTDATLLDVRSQTGDPDYRPVQTGGGLWLPADVGWVTHRNQYRVLVSCAGPHSIRYAFAQPTDQTKPIEAFETYADTGVECDGAVHEDVLDLPLDEARFVVTSTDQTAWHVVVIGDPLPIALAPDEDGWTTSSGFGPNWQESGYEESISLPGEEKGGNTRIVISCFGDTTITGTIDVGAVVDEVLDPYTLDCNPDHENSLTIARIYPRAAGQVHVAYDPQGAKVWFVVTVQIRDPNPTP